MNMLTGVLCLFLAVLCAVEAQAPYENRFRRATGSSGSGSSSYSGSSSNSGGGGGGSGGGFQYPTSEPYPYYPFHNPMFGGYPMFDFNSLFQQYLASLAAAHAYAASNPQYAPFPGPDSNAIIPDGGYGPTGGGFGATGGGYGGTGGGPVFTSASASLGPQGGFGQASAAPGGPDGLGVRIAQEFGPPSGGSFGTFSSSSSGSSDVNGKRTSFKSATFGTNDNGKITFKTVSE